MKSMTRLFVLVLLAGMVSFGCGGGGGGGSTDDGGAPVPESTYVLSGTVTVSGGGTLAGVTITLSGASSGTFTTDANGYYSFSNLANGAYTVTPTLVGYIFTPASQAVTVNGADVTGVSFTATESTSPTNTSYTIIDLGTLGGKQSYAAAINNTGMVIGESDNSDGLSLAFLYSDGSIP